ncbi:hypothetical protein IMX26_17240 [Clostridium sp. 'deep sea']|uniref:YfjL-like protein n=1 Tax=Clostridium sp. 'deep sea' TaxID=2779445 RepID=UPI0018968FD9|nr:hypothetical protein [Clostridium sp. 'deep sea']QOR35178.1 hypothetical protein IMX26_17240 [Clostridium sp. 'deep sea']
MKNKLWIILVVLVCVAIGFIYNMFWGSLFTRMKIDKFVKEYTEHNYPDIHASNASYDFLNGHYIIPLQDENNNRIKYEGLSEVFSNNVMNFKYANNIFYDGIERYRVLDEICKLMPLKLHDISLNYNNSTCSVLSCIETKKSLLSIKEVERYDIVRIRIHDSYEISEDDFANIIMDIYTKINKIIKNSATSEIQVTYITNNNRFKVAIKEFNNGLTKDKIIKNIYNVTYE